MLKAALCGGYVNFGVFGLYGDNALEKALKTFVELLSSIPHSNLLVSCLPSRVGERLLWNLNPSVTFSNIIIRNILYFLTIYIYS